MKNTSYWESISLLKEYDHCVIGAGIVGLSTAIELADKKPKSKILVLDKSTLPIGASYKNAGFACFGSSSELISDLKHMSEDKVFELVEMRIKGLNRLRKRLADSQLDYIQHGSFELFQSKSIHKENLDQLNYLNNKLKKHFHSNAFSPYTSINDFGFPKHIKIIKNNHEGQLNTGLMMQRLKQLCHSKGIEIINNIEITKLSKGTTKTWELHSNIHTFKSIKVYICNNAYAKKLLPNIDLKPARAQVLITKPIDKLKIRGCFHMDEGYYYFRNIHNRILFGGGRNLAFKDEETYNTNTTKHIQNKLLEMLKQIILPNSNFEIDYSWTGTMGVGKSKSPIVKQLDDNLYCGIRMGGMGVALGSEIGFKLANF